LQTGHFIASLPKAEAYHLPAVKVTTELPPTDAPANPSHSWNNLDQALSRALELAKDPTKQPVNSQAGNQAEFSANGTGFHRLAAPVAADLAGQRRFSVSRLSGQLQSVAEQSAPTSLFADEQQNTNRLLATVAGSDLGILVHQALARIDLAALAASAQSDRQEQIQAIVQHCLDGDDSRTADLMTSAVELIKQFLQSDRARQLATAKTVHRELEFLLAWPPEKTASTEKYLQGFIDCLYQDAAGRWYLLDYKTNHVSAAGAASLAPQFELQLGVYALAVEQILRQPPVELTVHFLRPAVEHQFIWNAALRDDIVRRVNQAIETTVMQKTF
jgi:ATP-dependent exoDNAse (exonuclease V) beta subunit